MKTIIIPKETYKIKELDKDGKEVLRDGNIVDFIQLALRSCPSSRGTLDKLFEVGKLINKLKDEKGKEVILDNDEYKLIEHCVTKELFEDWIMYQQQGRPVPKGWDIIGLNPMNDLVLTYLTAIKGVEDYSGTK